MNVFKKKRNRVIIFLFVVGVVIFVLIGVVVYLFNFDLNLLRIFFNNLIDVQVVNNKNNISKFIDLIKDNNVIESIKFKIIKLVEEVVFKIFEIISENSLVFEINRIIVIFERFELLIVKLNVIIKDIVIHGVKVKVIIEVILDRLIFKHDMDRRINNINFY